MRYAEGHIVNGRLVEENVKIIDQSTLTSECWMIQIKGAEACNSCKYKNKPRLCSGLAIRKKLGVPPPVTQKSK